MYGRTCSFHILLKIHICVNRFCARHSSKTVRRVWISALSVQLSQMIPHVPRKCQLKNLRRAIDVLARQHRCSIPASAPLSYSGGRCVFWFSNWATRATRSATCCSSCGTLAACGSSSAMRVACLATRSLNSSRSLILNNTF